MSTKAIEQSVFPPATVIQVYTPTNVDATKQSNRAPLNPTSALAGISAGASAVAATATVDPTGTNNSIDYTAATAGTAGNSITVAYTNDGASQTIDVDVVGTAITVSLATDGSSVITSTAANVRTAIAAHAGAAALVSTALHAGNDGSGLVTVMTATTLSGGSATLATNEALIPSTGTMTVTGVTTGQDYYAVGPVGSDYHYLRFNV